MELLHWIGTRMSDAVRLSEGMVDCDGWLTFRQQKTGGEVTIPVPAPAPHFADAEGQVYLIEAMAARPDRHALIMVTAAGAP